jgi:hypothetical protein
VCSYEEKNNKIADHIITEGSQIGRSYYPADRRAEDSLEQFSAPRGDSMQGDIGSLQRDQDICGKRAVFRSFC